MQGKSLAVKYFIMAVVRGRGKGRPNETNEKEGRRIGRKEVNKQKRIVNGGDLYITNNQKGEGSYIV